MPPTIRADPPDGNYVVKKGRKVELKCIASGNPDPTITWTRQVSFCNINAIIVANKFINQIKGYMCLAKVIRQSDKAPIYQSVKDKKG